MPNKNIYIYEATLKTTQEIHIKPQQLVRAEIQCLWQSVVLNAWSPEGGTIFGDFRNMNR